jgi:polysaccharide biosynthesis/export protein
MNLILALTAYSFGLMAQQYGHQNDDARYEVFVPYEKIDLSEISKGPYRIKIGDSFRISIYGEDQTTKNVVVSPTGDITYLFPEPVPAIGKTISEVRESLEEQLKKHYRHPYLSMTPLTFSGEYYTIIGEVMQPGSKLIEGNPTLLSALCDARGFTMNNYRDHFVDFADLDYSFIARNGEYLPIDFRRLVKYGDMSQDIPLRAGDFIYLPNKQLHKIYILGEVRTQRTYEYLETITLAGALTECGGLTLEASSRVAVIRNSLACPKQYYIDVNLLLKGCAPDFELQPGDIVYVPARNFTFLREVFRSAVRNFVNVVASDAGNFAFIEIQPQAAGIPAPFSTTSLGPSILIPGSGAAAGLGGAGAASSN